MSNENDCSFCFFSVADKAIQHVSPFSFPWPLGSGFPTAFLSELRTSISRNNNASLSSERQRMMGWDVNDVASHVTCLGCGDQAKIFIEQVIVHLSLKCVSFCRNFN